MTDAETTDVRASSSTFGIEAKSVAGAIAFFAGGVALLGIITAEVFYPGYTTLQEISDLGATRPPNSVIHQPSATIFNATMVTSGVLLLVATGLLHRALDRRVVSIPLALFGVGVLGVGVFPGNRVPWHGIFALLTFVSGGLAAVLSSRVVTRPFRYLCLAFGSVSLVALASAIFLGAANPLLVLGPGGLERWVVYPLLLWLTGFGGYLMGDGNRTR